VEQGKDVRVVVQRLHGSDLRAEHLEHPSGGGLFVDNLESHVLAAGGEGKEGRKGGKKGEREN